MRHKFVRRTIAEGTCGWFDNHNVDVELSKLLYLTFMTFVQHQDVATIHLWDIL